MKALGSLLEPREQLEYAMWIRRHRQDEREERIRELAAKYVAHHYGRDGQPGGLAHIPWTSGISCSYVPTTATKPVTTMDFQDITIDVDPRVQGFARQMIAEAQIRQQLDEIDEPYDD